MRDFISIPENFVHHPRLPTVAKTINQIFNGEGRREKKVPSGSAKKKKRERSDPDQLGKGEGGRGKLVAALVGTTRIFGGQVFLCR